MTVNAYPQTQMTIKRISTSPNDSKTHIHKTKWQ